MKQAIRLYRSDIVNRARTALERNGYPRLQMILLVTITGAAGFVASFTLLHLGLTQMWERYLLAFAIAYISFLFLLWLWLKTKAEDYTDIPGVSGSPSSGAHGGDVYYTFSGGGGHFGGGGASSSFDVSHEPLSAVLPSDAGPVGDVLEATTGAGEFAVPLVVIVLIFVVVSALAITTGWIIYSAPELFAELMIDGALTAGLYKSLSRLESRHWLETALRRTFLPFVFAAIIVSSAAWGMKLYYSEAHTIGDVIRQVKKGG